MFCVHSRLRLRSPVPSFHLCRTYQQTQQRHKNKRGTPELPDRPAGNALALELYKRNGYGKRAKRADPPPKGDRTRLNIVNEKLCGE
jgi:hypothetical protein